MSFLNPAVEAELKGILDRFACQAGSVHVRSGAQLFLVAAIGLPKQVLQMISVVAVGKGMAGLAAERGEAVQVCNLQTDDSGVARPGARATGMEGAIAVPMWGQAGKKRELKGVLGVAKKDAYEFSLKEILALQEAGKMLAWQMLKN